MFAVVRSEPIVRAEREAAVVKGGPQRRKLIMRCCADKVAKIWGAAAAATLALALLSAQLSHFTLH